MFVFIFMNMINKIILMLINYMLMYVYIIQDDGGKIVEKFDVDGVYVLRIYFLGK